MAQDLAQNRARPGGLGAGAPGAALPEIVHRSPGLDPGRFGLVVCVPTFRRPEGLRATLRSLRAQDAAEPFAVVVAENDAARAGAAVAAEHLDGAGLHGVCAVEPVQGNCSAINAAFALALVLFPRARAVLMIDDDEVASPGWLRLMAAAADGEGVEVVGGPVLPRFRSGKAALARHPAFRPAYDRTGPVPVIYGTGNCLIRREVFGRLAQPGLDPCFNHLGGGDTDFFHRCRLAGCRFHWVQEAVIEEDVPEERTRLAWLLRRSLRIGAVNFHVERRALHPARVWLRNLLAWPGSALRSARELARTGDPLLALHPLLVACGRSSAALGLEPHQYRPPPGG